MDVERTMEFILEQHARTEAVLAEVVNAQQSTDRRLDRLSRDVTRLARLGLRARSRLNQRADELTRRAEEHEKWFQEQKMMLHEMGEKLNALIDVVDRWPRNPA